MKQTESEKQAVDASAWREALRHVDTIVVHKDCADGMASAILLHDALPKARVIFVQHATREYVELLAEPGMLFCDIAPPPIRAHEFVAVNAIVLDHHKTSRHVVEKFGLHVFADEEKEPGVSGAVLAFRHVWDQEGNCDETGQHPRGRKRASDFAHLAGVRDTWQTKSSFWREACEQQQALLFWPPEHLLARKHPFAFDEFAGDMAIGKHLLARHEAAVDRALKGAWRFKTAKGTRVVIFQGLALTSDAAEKLGDSCDLVVGFGYEVEDGWHKLIASTRSHSTFDCSALARAYGGGGHTRAAGFALKFLYEDPNELPGANPYLSIQALVDRFERSPR